MSWVESVSLVVLLAWVALSSSEVRRWPKAMRLPTSSSTVRERSVVAIVPARDEAVVLAQTLPALLGQGESLAAIVLVDDASSDGTAELAREIGRARHPDLLRVVEASPTPSGWVGKLHALACGMEVVGRDFDESVEWVLFTDADIAHRRGSVDSLMARALGLDGGRRYDVVSVMARLEAESFWERLLIPPFVYFFQLLYPFRLVADPSSRVAATAGGCVLVRRSSLRRAGGLESIRGALIDDVALGKRLKSSGERLWLGLDVGIRSVRPYRSLSAIWQMVARSAFVQLGFRWSLVLCVVVSMAVFLVAPAAIAITVTTVAAGGGRIEPSIARAGLWSAATWGLQTLSLWPSVRHQGAPRVFSTTLPLAAALYALMTISSGLHHLRHQGVRWKGRTYGG